MDNQGERDNSQFQNEVPMMQRQPASALDLFTDSVRSSGDATMISVLEFDRHVQAERLETAARQCLKAHPILSSRLVRGSGPAYWEYQQLDASAALIEVIDIGEDDYRPHVIRGMIAYSAPQALFRVLRSRERDVLVISLAHAAADGTGLKELTNSLMAAYLDPASVRPSNDVLPVRDTLWTRSLIDSSYAAMDLELADTMWPMHVPISSAPSSFHKATVGPDGIRALKARAARCGGTINDLLMAAYYLTMTELTDSYGDHGLSFPVNLRQHLSDGSRLMSNQSANVTFKLSSRRGEGMEQVLPGWSARPPG